jgi:hypothetical protein
VLAVVFSLVLIGGQQIETKGVFQGHVHGIQTARAVTREARDAGATGSLGRW